MSSKCNDIMVVKENQVFRILSMAKKNSTILNIFMPSLIDPLKLKEYGYLEKVKDYKFITWSRIEELLSLGVNNYNELMQHMKENRTLITYIMNVVSAYCREMLVNNNKVVLTYRKHTVKPAVMVFYDWYRKYINARRIESKDVVRKLQKIWYVDRHEKIRKHGIVGIYMNILVCIDDEVLHLVSRMGSINEWHVINEDVDDDYIDLVISLAILK